MGKGVNKPKTYTFQWFCRKRWFSNRFRRGFTLLELCITVAIIGILASIAIPNYIGYRERARTTTGIATLKQLSMAIDLFSVENGRFPNDLNEIGMGNVLDPWGRPFVYLNISLVKGKGKLRKDHSLVPVNTDYDLYSVGPDGKSQTPFTAKSSRDDLVRANNGGFYGKVSDY